MARRTKPTVWEDIRIMNPKLLISATAATFLLSASALAQMPAPAQGTAQGTTQGVVQGTGQVGMALPGAAPAPQAQATQGDSDHDAMIGHLAVGFLGRRNMRIGNDQAGATPAFATIDAPVIGIRYWIDQLLGLDLGLGFVSSSGSTTVLNTSTDKPHALAAILHGGVPLSLVSAKHYSFQIVPEINVGLATGGETPGPGVDVTYSGFHLDLGARAGGEIHFGFMGIPQLALQGSVGIAVAIDSTTSTNNTAGIETSASNSDLTIGTSVHDNPWNIFTSNVAALYYF